MSLYALSHSLQAMLLPPGLNFLIIFIGVAIFIFYKTFGKITMLIGVFSIWLMSTPIVAYNMLNLLQNRYPILKYEFLKNPSKNSAIVILGGGESVNAEYGNKTTVSDLTLHRVNYGAYLHQNTSLPVIVSGGRESPLLPSVADLMDDVLLNNFHIEAKAKEDRSLNTADESKFISEILKLNKFDSIYLVTDAWHMPRSVYIFQCRGIKVNPAPMGHFVYGPGYSLLSFIPNANALYASSIAIHEFIGLVWYHLRYGKECV